MFVKPLLKTLLLSILVFGLIVILGMKFQWVEYLKGTDKKNIELRLPEDITPRLTAKDGLTAKDDFHLEIIRSDQQPITANMTKEQITSGCQQLYNKMGMQNNELIDMVVGDCVVSNYQETIQDTNQLTLRRQDQSSIEKMCLQKSNAYTQFSTIERQLLFGVCVSDGTNQ